MCFIGRRDLKGVLQADLGLRFNVSRGTGICLDKPSVLAQRLVQMESESTAATAIGYPVAA